MNDFALLLKTYRERRNLSQSALAREAGLDASFISRLERGERMPGTANSVSKLAKALRLNDQERVDLMLCAGLVPPIPPADTPEVLLAWALRDAAVPQGELERLRDWIRVLKEKYGVKAEPAGS